MKRGKKNRRVGTHRGSRALSNRSFRPLFLMIYFASITVLLHENNRTNYRRYSSFVRGTARESFDPILASIDKSSCVIFRGGATNNDSLRRERKKMASLCRAGLKLNVVVFLRTPLLFAFCSMLAPLPSVKLMLWSTLIARNFYLRSLPLPLPFGCA